MKQRHFSVTDTVRVIEVIEASIMRRGQGVEGDPIRIITQYWSLDGELLAEVDPVCTSNQQPL
jgi:hypothetical protein